MTWLCVYLYVYGTFLMNAVIYETKGKVDVLLTVAWPLTLPIAVVLRLVELLTQRSEFKSAARRRESE